MIDNFWFDGQRRDPANAYSVFGGSVQALQNLSTYNEYPNGGPPLLSVSTGRFEIKVPI
jgi:tyrosinase